jgi:glycine cleavage system H protein
MADELPDDLRYTPSHEWVRREGDEIVAGITAFAAEELGDVVYVQLPEVGTQVKKGEAFGEIESVKAVSDLYSPLSGEIIGTNGELDTNPGSVNEDPYGGGWMVRLRLDNPAEYDSLLDARAYEETTKDSH